MMVLFFKILFNKILFRIYSMAGYTWGNVIFMYLFMSKWGPLYFSMCAII